MGTINLGAFLFALLILVWVGYAVPRTAERRDVMGRARSAERTRDSTTARDLSQAARTRPRTHEVTDMSDDRLLLRPADPTSRPRFDADLTERVDPLAENARQRKVLSLVLAALAVVTIGVGVLAALSYVPAWLVAIPAVLLVGYVIGLRRSELERRERVRRAAEIARRHRTKRADRTAEDAGTATTADARRAGSAEDEAEDPADAEDESEHGAAHTVLGSRIEDAADTVVARGEWLPRPVPRPAYTLHGDVEDLASRHAVHRQSVVPRPVPLEAEIDDAEIDEFDDAMTEEAPREHTPTGELDLDDVLRRRRA